MDNMFAELKAIQASMDRSFFMIDPETEPRFIINSDKREIEIPDEFKFLAVKTDHVSEKIYFEVDRYFDGEDLSTKACVVQYINAGDGGSVEGIYPVTYIDLTTNPKKIIFRWEVDNNVSKYAGMVSFSVRFYTISDDNRFTYSWNTIPAQLPILDTINNTGNTVSENYPTELVEWNYRMQQLDRTISEKIATATESIDTNTKAAQAARQGAEDAEARVNAIVAGNEAYTKQQSHDLFALALRGTAEAAKSITIYPDKGSNVVATINGFTQQAGTGDPSPTNVRTLTNGGLKLKRLVLGSGTTFRKEANTFLYYSESIGYGGVFTVSNNYKWSEVDASAPKRVNLIGNTLYIVDPNYSDASSFNAYLSARYAAGNPVIVWYVPADESQATGLYAPIILQGGEYRATCLPLTAPLCEGDSVVNWARSGCDKVITLSSLSWSKLGSGTHTFSALLSDATQNQAYSDEYPFLPTVSTLQNCISVNNAGVFVTDLSCASVEDLQSKLVQSGAQLWYRSTNYTEAADIPASLETHVRAALVLDGTEKSHTYADYIILDEVSTSYAKNRYSGICSHYKYTLYAIGAIAVDDNITARFPASVLYNPGGAYTVDEEGLTKWKAYLAAQYAAGTPVTIVYELATPITYAHEAVVLPALPDDTGKVTIAGEADGTVSAEFNKNVTKVLEEILTRISALELHALGG